MFWWYVTTCDGVINHYHGHDISCMHTYWCSWVVICSVYFIVQTRKEIVGTSVVLRSNIRFLFGRYLGRFKILLLFDMRLNGFDES